MNTALRSLRLLNFSKLLQLDYPNIEGYSFDVYRNQNFQHAPVLAYCTHCEEDGCSYAKGDKSFRLTNISHGAHSDDFLRALPTPPDTSGWHDEPVAFVYESPSRDYGIYKQITFGKYQKRPASEWYWVHRELEPVTFPTGFKGGEYGLFVLSTILTFQLANAYVTNLVKCGLNDDQDNFKGIADYDERCIEKCFSTFLSREFEILKPKVVFAIGSQVYGWLQHFLGEKKYPLQQLPHPAGRRRGFRDEHFKVLYFWLVLRALFNVGILSADKSRQLCDFFLRHYDDGGKSLAS